MQFAKFFIYGSVERYQFNSDAHQLHILESNFIICWQALLDSPSMIHSGDHKLALQASRA